MRSVSEGLEFLRQGEARALAHTTDAGWRPWWSAARDTLCGPASCVIQAYVCLIFYIARSTGIAGLMRCLFTRSMYSPASYSPGSVRSCGRLPSIVRPCHWRPFGRSLPGGIRGGRDRLDALLSVLLNLHLLHGDVPVSIRPWPALYGRKAGRRLRLICTLRITTRSNSTPLTLGRETRRIG